MWSLCYLPSEAWRSSLVVWKQSRPKVGSGAKCSRLSVKRSKTNPRWCWWKSGKNVCRRYRPLTGTTELNERRCRRSLKSNTRAGFCFFLFFSVYYWCCAKGLDHVTKHIVKANKPTLNKTMLQLHPPPIVVPHTIMCENKSEFWVTLLTPYLLMCIFNTEADAPVQLPRYTQLLTSSFVKLCRA